jgi:hypothetical protein
VESGQAWDPEAVSPREVSDPEAVSPREVSDQEAVSPREVLDPEAVSPREVLDPEAVSPREVSDHQEVLDQEAERHALGDAQPDEGQGPQANRAWEAPQVFCRASHARAGPIAQAHRCGPRGPLSRSGESTNSPERAEDPSGQPPRRNGLPARSNCQEAI